ncbi:MAG: putative bifunctional protein (BirA) : transcriptional regulator (Biotin operon repressor), BirA [Pseudomonadota bacterium]
MRWDAETLWEQVQPLLPGFTVEVLPQIDSTNTELMRRARAGQLEPTLLIAEHQTAGRGRLGREWFSEPAGALSFSLGLPLSPHDWSGLSLAVGVSLARSLHPDLRLKWPNDLWLHERKLGGILIETASFAGVRFVVIGVGINVAPRPADGLSTPPACLQELMPDMDAAGALHRLALPLVQALQRFEAEGFAPFVAPFQALDALAGREVRLSDGTTGHARGVDGSGALQVLTSQGLQKITSAEFSVRPMAQPETPTCSEP